MTRMNCEYVRDVYPDLLNEKLDAMASQHVHAHVASCDACSAEIAILTSLHTQRIYVSNGMHARVVAAAMQPQPRKPAARVTLLMAASVAIALVGGSVLLQSRPDMPPTAAAARGFGFVSVETAMLSGKASLNDWTEAELEILLKEMES